MELKTGIKGYSKQIVEKHLLATTFKSGMAPVYATPAMIAFMEETCMNSVGQFIAKSEMTLGVKIDVQHVKALTVGNTVECFSTLEEIEGRKLTFYVEVKFGEDLVGFGRHQRVIVDESRFMEKLQK